MFDMILSVSLEGLIWQSDWNGDEVGFPDVSVVGYYCNEIDGDYYGYYIDTEAGRLLSFWCEQAEE